uniref:Ig-like domain-containing protein n=1 Tax=Equus asinus TaxID=9793 RepID=A0A9L0IGC9_EQUAS
MGDRARTPTLTALLCLGLCWGPCDQVQAGAAPKPSIWADPGPMVSRGSPMTIWCQGSLQADVYHLYKDRVSKPLDTEAPQNSSKKAGFSIESMSTHTAGLYQCAYHSRRKGWSERSDPLLLVVTGVYREPSLSAQPGSLVFSGDNLTLQCRSGAGFDRFALTKDEGLTSPQHLHGQHSPYFPLGHVSHTHGGQYRCYSGHNLSHAWSAPSDPLDILIVGMYEKPSISAQPGPSVSWGEKVTLQCRSEISLDSFHLSKEGSPAAPQLLRLQDAAAPFQASFTIGPVTSNHEGNYTCYSSDSTFPYLLSLPSDTLELLVSAPRPQDYTVENLIRMGGAALILVVLGILLFQARDSPGSLEDAARR